MIKCFQCIKDEYHQKIKWSQVEEAVVILQGQSYCFKHLSKEVDWKDASSTKYTCEDCMVLHSPENCPKKFGSSTDSVPFREDVRVKLEEWHTMLNTPENDDLDAGIVRDEMKHCLDKNSKIIGNRILNKSEIDNKPKGDSLINANQSIRQDIHSQNKDLLGRDYAKTTKNAEVKR